MQALMKRIAKLEKEIEKVEFNKRVPDWKYEAVSLEYEDLKKQLRKETVKDVG